MALITANLIMTLMSTNEHDIIGNNYGIVLHKAMALYRKNCMTLWYVINVIMTYDINDINLEVDINVSLPLGTMLALTGVGR